MLKKRRPVNLDLTTIQFPLPAIISVLHRISGLILFLLIPIMLCGLSHTLRSAEDFQAVTLQLNQPGFKIVIGLMLSALFYHLIAGIRHMVMDIGIGESLKAGRFTSKLTLIFFVIAMLMVVFYLW